MLSTYSTLQNISYSPLPYNSSELLALSLGYTEFIDDKAYRQRVFILNGKKWIHNIEALRKKLGDMYGRFIDDEELSAEEPEGFGYDVENYYLYHSVGNSKLTQDINFKALLKQMRVSH